jgi:hypothetical protein
MTPEEHVPRVPRRDEMSDPVVPPAPIQRQK